MVIHARSGVPYEIMGMMQGKVTDNTLIIVDSFALPVKGTETRVNAGNEASEYMVQYKTNSEQASPATVALDSSANVPSRQTGQKT